MRYENKFVFNSCEYNSVETKIMLSPFCFNEIFNERKINNIYLDSFDYKNYYANIMGEQNRVKQRIRWYGDTKKATNPILEYKIKHGELGTKEYYRLPDFILNEKFSYSEYLKQLEGDLKEESYINMFNDVSEQIPTLYNSYDRRYFLSADGKYRITIDKNMIFNSISETYNGLSHFSIDKIVVELKYDSEYIDGASTLLQHFGFRLSRNSKYVNGVSGLYFNDVIQ